MDVAGHPGTDHVFLVNGTRFERIEAANAPLPYCASLVADVRNRTEMAMLQAHFLKVMELALKAQAVATRLGACA